MPRLPAGLAQEWDSAVLEQDCSVQPRGCGEAGRARVEDAGGKWRSGSCSLPSHLGIPRLCPKRGKKYKMAGRVKSQVCKNLYWDCGALCCGCHCPLPYPPEFCGQGKGSSNLSLTFEGRHVQYKSPNISWKLEGNSHHSKSCGP